MDREAIIKTYFDQGYSYQEISNILKKNGFSLSYRQLQRIIQSLGLKRKNIIENIPEIVTAMINELQDSGCCLGYKSMWSRLKLKYGLQVYRETVLDLLQILDPEGIEERSKYRLKRRLYSVPGPNFIWHIDGYDKLKPYGFAIHGCVDGYSRKVLWLELSTTNNKPEVICHYYLKTIEKLKLIPTLVRSDHGTENSIVELVHQALRSSHEDSYAGIKSFLKGKSTANQRIESSWGRMRRHSVNFWILFFKDMIDCNHYDKSNALQVECLRFCFGPLIKYDLDLTRKEWNRHSIRKQKLGEVQSGKPNYLFYNPTANGTVNCGHEVKSEHIANAKQHFSETASYCSPIFLKLVNEIFADIQLPINAKEATFLYHKILVEIKRYE